jgi:hypothetical protein
MLASYHGDPDIFKWQLVHVRSVERNVAVLF